MSMMVITCSHETLLPHGSTAVHVRTMLYGQSPVIGPSTKLIIGSEQSSVAVAEPVTSGVVAEVQSMVMFAGQLITGAAKSLMVINCTHELLLPHTSIAVQVRSNEDGQSPLTMPSTKLISTAEQLSVAVAKPASDGSDEPLSQFTV